MEVIQNLAVFVKAYSTDITLEKLSFPGPQYNDLKNSSLRRGFPKNTFFLV